MTGTNQPFAPQPLLVFILVPVAWGTYPVAVKKLYDLPAPPPEFLFILLNGFISSVATWSASSLKTLGTRRDSSNPQKSFPTRELKEMDVALRSNEKILPIWQGFELCSYLFFASIFQIFGLQATSAVHGRFHSLAYDSARTTH